jgi:ribosomal protein S18 acetylase RimI-like enzyme
MERLSENKKNIYRPARFEDLPAIVKMLADDPLGAQRETYTIPLPFSYKLAFATIAADPNNELIVAEADSKVAGVLQVTFIPNLTYEGRWRALIEGVRVSKSHRSSGIGRGLIESAVDLAKERGCLMVQLTTDKSRPEALRFYEKLGFTASHEGMKMKLT